MPRISIKVPIIDIPCRGSSREQGRAQQVQRITVHRTRQHSFHRTVTINSNEEQNRIVASEHTRTRTNAPARARSSSVQPAHSYSSQDQDGDVDELADQLLEHLGLALDDEDEVDQESSRSTSKFSTEKSQRTPNANEPALKPQRIGSGTCGKSILKTHNPNSVYKGPTVENDSYTDSPTLPNTSLISTSSPSSSIYCQDGSSAASVSSRSSVSTIQPVSDTSRQGRNLPHSNLDTVYAEIIDMEDQTSQAKVGEGGKQSRFGKILRKVKNFANLRLAISRTDVQPDDERILLGDILTPPGGASHFEVQLTICGLLRRNAASPYELYHFFLENGFYNHLSSPPDYESWAECFKRACKAENAFYREGIRVGLTGEMDFLRNIFQEWCEAWHDWRLTRPVPSTSSQ